MCGIIGAFDARKNAKVNSWVVDQYEEQHDRGRQGFSVTGWNGQGKVETKRSCTEAKFMFDLHAKGYAFMLAHHRMPTSSMNALDQTHPIAVRHDGLKSDWLVVHNGVIRNCNDLKAKHKELGFGYATAHLEVSYDKEVEKFNDSEALAIEVARFIEGKTGEVGSIGSAAFVALELDKKTGRCTQVHFGSNGGNPLNVVHDECGIVLSSEGPGENCKANVLYSFEPKGEMEIGERPMPFVKEPPKAPTADWKPLPSASYTPKYAYAERDADDRQPHWWDDDDYTGVKPMAMDDGIQFREPALDDYLESMETECHDFLGLLDDKETFCAANVDAFVKAMRSYAEEAIETLNEKHSETYAKLSDERGDTGGEAEDHWPLPAAASGVEKGKL